MVNVRLLRGKMTECKISVDELAKKMGIDRATLYRRLNTDREKFSIKEADMIVKILSLTKEEANKIFFSQFVAWYAK